MILPGGHWAIATVAIHPIKMTSNFLIMAFLIGYQIDAI
ncbi:hypothetical protein JCM19297_153 [Nonlabens ulvanivorans]|nr:hypothetical protein JCM19297_153 [Nonlabens ulvanivorans]